MVNDQANLFIIFTVNGIIIGIVFDLFRILRKTFVTKDWVTYIEDIIFWIITGAIILYSMCVFCDGELRFFMILGIIMGVTIYMLTISKYVIKISVFLINIVKGILVKIIKIIMYPFIILGKVTKKVIFRPISIICINIRKNIWNFVKKIKKHRGFFVKKEKYNSI